ncbi:HPr kinase/phosphorylase [Methylobacterium pseudosasicola]|uniref:HPr Serine kinase C-terminal domain-containing protein n=1 Tax=Methylobacterium pseudosasicola TaxID=582667 RepID=A0A1I4PEZ9_9HYPH|nr:HPr kinase/phosphatase C-terminal domain-containing protein [Methylobacterium pseudosasicola]SFM26267.1 HPr Serine kinase C-terminal domain-containing protein [Methylobacterium pseudosasicola]
MPSLHAACVVLGESGILIRGPSGSGKSSLALLLAAERDGAFVADDRVVCERRAGTLVARPHDALVGQVEIRGQGILSAQDLGLAIRPEAIVGLAIDLVAESPRLPEPPEDAEILDLRIPRLVLDRGVRRAGLAPLLIRAALRKQKP